MRRAYVGLRFGEPGRAESQGRTDAAQSLDSSSERTNSHVPHLFYSPVTESRTDCGWGAELTLGLADGPAFRPLRWCKFGITMLQIYRVPVPKDRLRAMPRDERVLLLLLGYAANQLSMLQKLLTFATNRTPDAEVEQHATGTQTQMLVRLTVGALNEAWELVSTRFIRNPMAKDYVGRLDPAGQQAFAELKRQFGGSNLLNAVRNNYAFHYPRSDEAEDAFEAAFSDKGLDGCWNFYFSQHGFNSLFFLSDLIFVHGIGRKAG
jgi:hypothetical protein